MKTALKYLFAFIFFLTCFSPWSSAKELKIKSFSMMLDPMTVEMQRSDLNGEICALVKVIIPSPKASFEGSIIGNPEYKTSEYWCYLKPGSKLLKIKYPGTEPLMVDFESLMNSGVKSKQIYELLIEVPELIQNNPEFDISGQINFKDLESSWFRNVNKREVLDKLYGKLKIYLNYNKGQYEDRVDNLNYISNKFNFNGVHVGDSITVIPNDLDYLQVTIQITPEMISKNKFDIDIERKIYKSKYRLIDKTTKQPLPDVRISTNKWHLDTDEFFDAKTDSNGFFNVDIKSGLFQEVFINNSDLPDYYKKNYNSIILSPITDRETYGVETISRKQIENWIVFDSQISIEDLKVTNDNVNPDLKYTSENVYRRYQRIPFTFKITYPDGFDTNYVTVSAPGYKTIRIYGSVSPYSIKPIKMKKGKESEIIEYRYINGKIITSKI